MPLALSREETAPVCLKSDADKPEAERPTFLFYHLSRREVRRAQELFKQAIAEDGVDPAKCDALLKEMIGLGLAGWRNMRGRDGEEIPYDPERLDDLLTTQEMAELAMDYVKAVQDVEAKKKSASTSTSAPASGESASPA